MQIITLQKSSFMALKNNRFKGRIAVIIRWVNVLMFINFLVEIALLLLLLIYET